MQVCCNTYAIGVFADLAKTAGEQGMETISGFGRHGGGLLHRAGVQPGGVLRDHARFGVNVRGFFPRSPNALWRRPFATPRAVSGTLAAYQLPQPASE